MNPISFLKQLIQIGHVLSDIQDGLAKVQLEDLIELVENKEVIHFCCFNLKNIARHDVQL